VQSNYKRAADAFAPLASNTGFLAAAVNMDATTGTDSPPADDAAVGLMLACDTFEIQATVQALKSEAIRARTNALAQVEPDVLDLYLVKQGDTLRRISTKYFQTPDRWGDIADFNGLPTDSLSVGMVLQIPR
jgi:nucleoid-associated protein YgaU